MKSRPAIWLSACLFYCATISANAFAQQFPGGAYVRTSYDKFKGTTTVFCRQMVMYNERGDIIKMMFLWTCDGENVCRPKTNVALIFMLKQRNTSSIRPGDLLAIVDGKRIRLGQTTAIESRRDEDYGIMITHALDITGDTFLGIMDAETVEMQLYGIGFPFNNARKVIARELVEMLK